MKIIIIAALLSISTLLGTSSATENPDIFTVTNSPFGHVLLKIGGTGTGEAWRDAERLETPAPLEVAFFLIIQEIDSSAERGKLHVYMPLLVTWDTITFRVDPKVGGMTLSYRREWIAQRPLGGVLLTVPTEQDQKQWEERAKEFYLKYTTKFWEKRAKVKERRRSAEEEEKRYQERLEKLRKGPIPIFP